MTTAFTATATVGHPVDGVWAQLVDWDKERLATVAALDPGRSMTLSRPFDERRGVASRTRDQVCDSASGRRPAGRLRRHVHVHPLWRGP
jgi:hypothetical protein